MIGWDLQPQIATGVYAAACRWAMMFAGVARSLQGRKSGTSTAQYVGGVGNADRPP